MNTPRQADATAPLTVSHLIVLWLGGLFALPTIGFWLGLPIGVWQAPLATLVILSIALTIGFDRRILRWLTLLAVSLLWARFSRDFAWDSWVYHQPAIIALLEGWNPLHEPSAATWLSRPEALAQPHLTLIPERITLLLTHYGKATWVMAAAIAAAAGDLDSGKAINLLAICASFGLGLRCFRQIGLSPRTSIGLATAVALHAVGLAQVNAYYQDGLFGSLLLIAVFSALAWLKQRAAIDLIVFFIAVILAVNTKASAFLFCGVLVLWIAWQQRHDGRDRLRRPLAITAAAGVALLVLSINPFLSNTLSNGHPFHPLNQRNIVANQIAADFQSLPMLVRFHRSLFSRSENSASQPPTLTAPFSVQASELTVLRESYDTRISGFGPLFGEALYAALALLVGLVLVRRGALGADARRLLTVAALVLLSCALFSGGWWARYVPHLWCVPVLVAAAALNSGQRLAGWLLLALFGLNALLLYGARMPFLLQTYPAYQAAFESLTEPRSADPTGALWLRPSSHRAAAATLAYRLHAAGHTVRLADDQARCETPFAYIALGCEPPASPASMRDE